jgi:hypothetical protein
MKAMKRRHRDTTAALLTVVALGVFFLGFSMPRIANATCGSYVGNPLNGCDQLGDYGTAGVPSYAGYSDAGVAWAGQDFGPGVGVEGLTATGVGVVGAQGSITLPASGSNYGVWGGAVTSYGVYGTSTDEDGVHGAVSNGWSGIAGVNSSDGPGAYGSSSTGYGVYGTTGGTGSGAAAVYGNATASGGVGVYGSGYAQGVYGYTSSTGDGVLGYCGGSGNAVEGEATGSSEIWSGVVDRPWT